MFNGVNPYLGFIGASLSYLDDVIEQDDWQALRRKPPLYTLDPDVMQAVSAMVSQRIAEQTAPFQR